MIQGIKIEICCGTIEDCICANEFDVDRIELNSALELGGLTPTVSTLKMAKRMTRLPICCMVRPRTAGFVYTKHQIENMMMDARDLLEAGADGIVFGFLHSDHSVDVKHTKEMVELIHSYHREAVFHKAFDECKDLDAALQTLIDCGVERILSGGGKVSIDKGSQVIGELYQKYKGKIELLVGGGITPSNIKDIAANAKCGQIHMTAKKTYYDDGNYVAVDRETLKMALEQISKE